MNALELMDKYEPNIAALARRWKVDAAEYMSATWMAVEDALAHDTTGGDPSWWYLSKYIMGEWRKAGDLDHGGEHESLVDEHDEHHAAEDDPAWDGTTSVLINSLFTDLTSQERDLLWKRYVEGWKLHELSVEYTMPIPTIHRKLQVAKEILRKQL